MSSSSSSPVNLIINAAGADRLGIVSDVTGLVIEAGGNVGESVAGRLGPSYFSLMMLVSVPGDERDSLQEKIRTLSGLESAVFTVPALEAKGAQPQVGCECFVVYFVMVFFFFFSAALAPGIFIFTSFLVVLKTLIHLANSLFPLLKSIQRHGILFFGRCRQYRSRAQGHFGTGEKWFVN